MSEVKIIANKTDIIAIADAVRSKTGNKETMTLGGIVSGIQSIGTGSGGENTSIYALVEQETNIKATSKIILPSGEEYYYNHEQFPEIPAYVLEGYPYIIIVRGLTTTRIFASDAKFYVTEVNGVKRVQNEGASRSVRLTLNAEANAWMLDNSTTSWWYINSYGDGNSVVWWSNYDVPNGSLDSTEIYFPASEPKTEQPAEATHYYYNGMILPNIPNEDYGSYTYLMILKCWADGKNDLCIYASNTKPYYRINESVERLELPGGRTRSILNTETGEWGDANVGTSSTWCNLSTSWEVIWSNSDIPNGSATATNIYYYGTLAVPSEE